MLRISATYSCSQWYSHGLVKYFNPVVPHTPKRKQQRDHFRWNYALSLSHLHIKFRVPVPLTYFVIEPL
jgi:hypothetical protein